MKIIKVSDENAVQEAVSVLESGGLVIYPTETAYGVGVDATNPRAVDKLIEYKKIPADKPTSIAVKDEEMAQKYVTLNQTAKNFYKNFLPGPYTIISQALNSTDQRLHSSKGTLGIRIPAHEFVLKLIGEFDKPITATSANSHGKKTPYSIQDVLDTLSEKQRSKIDLMIDAGELPKRPASTVIDTTTDELTIYRGGILNPVSYELKEKFSSGSIEETIEIGKKIFQIATKNKTSLILLDGDLGSGKTHLTKGIAKALGIERTIKSPSFNYVNEYTLREPLGDSIDSVFNTGSKLYHYDAWRIETLDDLNALKIEDSINQSSFVVIEWPGVIKLLKPDFFDSYNYIYVEIKKSGPESRTIKVLGEK